MQNSKKIAQYQGFKLISHKESSNFYFPKNIQFETKKKIIKLLKSLINQVYFHEFYDVIKRIGEGHFANVFLARKESNNKYYAVKVFNKESLTKQNLGKESLINEIKIMRSLSHKNLLSLKEVFETQNSYYLVCEHIPAGNLKEIIKQKYYLLNQEQIKIIFLGVMNGLQELTKKGIMHRDIKPDNILLRQFPLLSEEDICIADMGLSSFIADKEILFPQCGTPGYVAPEILNNYKPQKNCVCDIFSAGVILHFLLLEQPVFNGRNLKKVLASNKQCQINFKFNLYKQLSGQSLDLLKKMLQKDPNKRIKCDQVLKHEFFTQKHQGLFNQFKFSQANQISPSYNQQENSYQDIDEQLETKTNNIKIFEKSNNFNLQKMNFQMKNFKNKNWSPVIRPIQPSQQNNEKRAQTAMSRWHQKEDCKKYYFACNYFLIANGSIKKFIIKAHGIFGNLQSMNEENEEQCLFDQKYLKDFTLNSPDLKKKMKKNYRKLEGLPNYYNS